MAQLNVTAQLTPIWFPGKAPEAIRAYPFDISGFVSVGTDLIASVAVSIAPSGAGELQATRLSVSGYVLTLTEAAGQPTRVYTIKYLVTMTDGLIYEFIVYQGVLAVLPADTAPVAPVPGFGAPITFPSGQLTDENGNLLFDSDGNPLFGSA